MKKLEAIQRKGLSICLGLPSTAGREAMEVACNISPLDLRFSEISVRDMAKIMAKPFDYPLKQELDKYRTMQVTEK